MDKIVQSAYLLYDEALEAVRKNNISGALNRLEKSILIYGKDKAALNLLGLCYYRVCRFDLARNYWIKSLMLDQADNPAKGYLEFIASEDAKELMKEYAQGLDALSESNLKIGAPIFRSIIKQYPDLIEPYLILGLCYYHKRRYIKAYSIWRRVRKLDRGNQKASQYLAGLIPVKLRRFGVYKGTKQKIGRIIP